MHAVNVSICAHTPPCSQTYVTVDESILNILVYKIKIMAKELVPNIFPCII